MRPYGDRTAAGPGTTPPLAARVHPRPLIATLLLAAFLLLPSMASVGMFFDGAIYASVSRNLAAGEGSLWAPHFSDALFPVFREHPPLVFWLQSLLFRLLGDTYLTERAYDLVVVVLSGLAMRAIWLRLTGCGALANLKAYWWLAILLWVLVPKWSWTYRNNVLENTLTLFCLVSVLASLAAMQAGGRRELVLGAGVALLSAVAALLSKGPTALFVLIAPLALFPGVGGVAVTRVAGLLTWLWLGTAALLAALVLGWSDAREMLTAYLDNQVLGRVGLGGGTAMLLELIKKLLPMALVAAAVWAVATRGARPGWWRRAWRPALAMGLIGLAASVPLVAGDRDSAHYLVPSLPFYAIGFGVLTAVMLEQAPARVRTRLTGSPGPVFASVAALVLMAILAFSAARIGAPRKNVAYHRLFAEVAEVTGQGVTLGLDSALFPDWTLHAVAQRHYRLSLDPEAHQVEWWLAPAGAGPEPGFEERVLEQGEWVLWR